MSPEDMGAFEGGEGRRRHAGDFGQRPPIVAI